MTRTELRSQEIKYQDCNQFPTVNHIECGPDRRNTNYFLSQKDRNQYKVEQRVPGVLVLL